MDLKEIEALIGIKIWSIREVLRMLDWPSKLVQRAGNDCACALTPH
jgi:hypothetical protein